MQVGVDLQTILFLSLLPDYVIVPKSISIFDSQNQFNFEFLVVLTCNSVGIRLR